MTSNPPQRLNLPPTPQNHSDEVDCWVSEKLWGHRLFNIHPWLIFLEFLTICEAQSHKGLPALFEEKVADDDGGPWPFSYFPAQRLRLRNILSNRIEEKIERENSGAPDSAKWEQWEREMRKDCEGFQPPVPEFTYVKKHFHQFQDFVLLVQSLRSFIIEETESKRWSSQFLFPFGETALYEDLDIKKSEAKRDRIYFTRSGEVFYQMLCRSKNRDALNKLLPKLLKTGNPWSQLCGALDDPTDDTRKRRSGSVLPYVEHPRFDALAEDFCAILELDIPPSDAVPHLVTLTGFHLMQYVQDVAAATLEVEPPTFICELLAPQRSTIRARSIASFDENRRLSEEAVSAELERIKKAFLDSGTPQDVEGAKDFVEKATGWRDEETFAQTDDVFTKLDEKVLKTHRGHLGKVHSDYGRGIGLVSRRSSNRNRYVPSDSFLKTITLTTVPTHCEFKMFMDKLHARYRLVFGEVAQQKQPLKVKHSKHDFKLNSDRLERRLASLGLLKRKSDGCAYLFNPHRKT